ncbi:hypothetical protein ACFL6M_05285, partial [Candidatus Eisenbacteria bacterium]
HRSSGGVGLWHRGVEYLPACLLTVLFVLLSAGIAGAESRGQVILSWESDQGVTNIAWPGAGTNARLPLYLTVDVDQAIEQLGFYMRWAAAEPGAHIELSGIRGKDQTPLLCTRLSASDTTRVGRWSAGGWSIESEALQQLAHATPDGTRYDLVLELELSGTRSAHIEICGVVASVSDQRFDLGGGWVGIGGGQLLSLKPLITEVTGRLNRRFIESVITFRGVGLEEVAGLVLLDAAGERHYQARIVSHTERRIDLGFMTKLVPQGLADVEITATDYTRDTLRAAVEVALLKERQPGDSNKGVIPGDR